MVARPGRGRQGRDLLSRLRALDPAPLDAEAALDRDLLEAKLRTWIWEIEELRLHVGEMQALATRLHPSGDLRTVWELMKEEAPPWPEVLPMAQRYV